METRRAIESCRHLICHPSKFRWFAHCLSFHMHFFCGHRKQLNCDLKSISFVMLAVCEEVVLMSSSYSKTASAIQLLYVHEELDISLHLHVFHYYYICYYYNVETTSAVEGYRHLICHLSTFKLFTHCFCSHLCFSCVHCKQLNKLFCLVHNVISLASLSFSLTWAEDSFSREMYCYD